MEVAKELVVLTGFHIWSLSLMEILVRGQAFLPYFFWILYSLSAFLVFYPTTITTIFLCWASVWIGSFLLVIIVFAVQIKYKKISSD